VFSLCASNMCAGRAATSPSSNFRFTFICYRVSDIVQNEGSRHFYMNMLSSASRLFSCVQFFSLYFLLQETRFERFGGREDFFIGLGDHIFL
jgi:hypothetical protein